MVRGELDLAFAPAFLERVRALAQHRIETLTIDLANLTFIDSAGINALNQLRIPTESHTIPFALAAVPSCAQRVLEITGMDALFTYH